MSVEPLQTPSLIQRIAAEINRLRGEQESARRKAAFVGMTEMEATEYKQRAARISQLVQQLEMVQPRKA